MQGFFEKKLNDFFKIAPILFLFLVLIIAVKSELTGCFTMVKDNFTIAPFFIDTEHSMKVIG